jgi:hypothetical protein
VAVLGTGTALLVSAFAWVADPQAGLGSAAAMLVGLWVFVTSFGVWLGALHSMGALRADLSLLHRRAAPQAAAAQTLQQAQRRWAGWALALLPPTLVFSLVGTGRWADPLHLAGLALQVLLFALGFAIAGLILLTHAVSTERDCDEIDANTRSYDPDAVHGGPGYSGPTLGAIHYDGVYPDTVQVSVDGVRYEMDTRTGELR